MKKAEFIFLAVASIAVLMSLFLISGAAILLILAFSTMALLYVPYGFFGVHNLNTQQLKTPGLLNNLSALKGVSGIVLGFAVSIVLVGTLFKLMTWPGAEVMLIAGLIGLGCAALLAVIGSVVQENTSYSFVFVRAAFYGAIGVFLATLPRYAIIEFKYKEYPSYIQSFKKFQENPGNEELRAKLHEERMKMNKDR